MPANLTTTDPPTATDLVRFHLSLNVDDLARSVEFFELLFDLKPARLEHDYAKFELDEPPIVLSLEPNRAPRGGKLNHLGFRLTSGEALVAMQRRLEMHGILTNREDGIECCYSQQTKFWLDDPDGNLWEIYTLEKDQDHCEHRPTLQALPITEPPAAAPAIWAHRLGEEFPPRILAETAGVDEVFLQGTFNARLGPEEPQRILIEVARILKPGAPVTIHQLSAKSPLTSLREPLPGPAAAVQAVPTAQQLVDAMQAVGFVDIHFEKLGNAPCFIANGVECRETRIVGFKPRAKTATAICEVLYKGPFRQVEDDRGHTFRRGEWTAVDAITWEHLNNSPGREQFALKG